MKKAEIRVGGIYIAKVNNKLQQVKVTAIREIDWRGQRKSGTSYDVVNLATGRTTTFRSAAKFREEVKPEVVTSPTVSGIPARTAAQSGTTTAQTNLGGQHTKSTPFDADYTPMDRLEKAPATPSNDGIVEAMMMAGKTSTIVAAGKLLSGFGSKVVLPTRSPMGSIQTAPHLIVEARAGTGKTTTLVEGIKVVLGMEPRITPSVQQKAVWESMALSRGVTKIAFVAFNRAIANELKSRVPAGCDAMTNHGMGFRAVGKSFRLLGGDRSVQEFRVDNIMGELLRGNPIDLRKQDAVFFKVVKDLVGHCKMALKGWEAGRKGLDISDAEQWRDDIDQLISHFEIDTDDMRSGMDRVYDLVPRVLERCLDVNRDGCIDYNDMVWLPIVLDLPMFKYELLLVDEAQDLNRCQQELAKKAGQRIILCGDPKQAIYGFAGADCDSMDNMMEQLSGTNRGCTKLPLTVTRRCGKAIVIEANKIVEDFEAFETNPEGLIRSAAYPTDKDGKERKPNYMESVQDGDMVLCRVNAPLVSQCFRFIKQGRKANIQGRDVGKGLVSLVNKLKATDVGNLIERLGVWMDSEVEKENRKKFPSESKIIAIQDKHDCLLCFTDSLQPTADTQMVVTKIEMVFTDNKDAPGIRCSSIHKAKGLEAHRVFLLEPDGATVPHPMAKSAWQRKQEFHLRYVAITRAIEELVYVS